MGKGNGDIPFERVLIMPPRPGACPICAAMHAPEQPHNRDSVYYQMRFRQRHGRTPTWADAMAHCDEDVKRLLTEELVQRGVCVGAEEDVPDEE
jgi:hypothetical protein